MLKILLNAYACNPNWGSEQGIGWHWTIELAKYNKADAIICFNISTEMQRDGANTMLTTKASGLAVRIIADEGYSIEYPVSDVWNPSEYEYTDEELEAEAAAETSAEETSSEDEVENVE